MSMPTFTIRQLLEAGVHFGHQTARWNPRMKPYIFGERNGIHIIDLQQTAPMLYRALQQVRDVVAGGGRVLFVGTKRQASEQIAETAKRCAQYYVNHRWLGGTLTNWKTISNSIRRLNELNEMLADGQAQGLTKKELLNLERERDKLERGIGGIREMGGLPDIMIVIDTNKEGIAIKEARKLNIPVVAIVDTNCDPADADFPVPGNDDAMRAIALYLDLFEKAIIDGLETSAAAAGFDLGEQEELPGEALPGDEAGDGAAEAAAGEGGEAAAPAAAETAETADPASAGDEAEATPAA